MALWIKQLYPEHLLCSPTSTQLKLPRYDTCSGEAPSLLTRLCLDIWVIKVGFAI